MKVLPKKTFSNSVKWWTYRTTLASSTDWPSADRGHMEYDPFVDLPGGENFRDVTALFEDAAEGDQICLR